MNIRETITPTRIMVIPEVSKRLFMKFEIIVIDNASIVINITLFIFFAPKNLVFWWQHD